MGREETGAKVRGGSSRLVLSTGAGRGWARVGHKYQQAEVGPPVLYKPYQYQTCSTRVTLFFAWPTCESLLWYAPGKRTPHFLLITETTKQ